MNSFLELLKGPLNSAAELFGIGHRTLTRNRTIVFGAALLVLAFGVLRSSQDADKFAGADLRARVVAARCLSDGLNPYTYTQNSTTTDRLRDPWRYFAEVSRCTYSPALITLYIPFCELPYNTQRWLWWGAEWACLLGSIALLSFSIRGQGVRFCFVTFALVFFCGSHFWRFHVERGQHYIFVVFLASLGAFVLSRLSGRKGDSWFAGAILGVASSLRPTFSIIALPLMILKRPRTAIATVLAFGACVGATSLAFGPGLWKDFVASGQVYERSFVLDLDQLGHITDLERLKTPVDGRFFGTMLPANSMNASPLSILYELRGYLFNVFPMNQWPTAVHAASAVGVIALCLLLVLTMRTRIRPEHALGLSMIVVVALDIFIPVRFVYADVIYLVPLGLLARPLIKTGGWIIPSIILGGFAVGAFATSVAASFFQSYAILVGLVAWLVSVTIFRPRARAAWFRGAKAA